MARSAVPRVALRPIGRRTALSEMKILARVLTDEVPGGYRITMETDDGQTIQVFATENK